MSFQSTVFRQYTTGFPGDIVRDGPTRAKPARIASDNVGANTNAISRVFGFNSDQSEQGLNGSHTLSAYNYDVVVGGKNFYGVLGNPKRYALYGGSDGALSPTYVLPKGVVGEFFDMVTGMVAEVFNFGTATQNIEFGFSLAYVPNDIATADNPNAIPHGALVAYTGTVPTGLVAIPNARVINPVSVGASSPTELASTYTIVQLTQ